MDRAQIFHSDPEILGGQVVFVGTRVPIDTLFLYLRRVRAIAEFREDFPAVSREQVEGLLALASRQVAAAAATPA